MIRMFVVAPIFYTIDNTIWLVIFESKTHTTAIVCQFITIFGKSLYFAISKSIFKESLRARGQNSYKIIIVITVVSVDLCKCLSSNMRRFLSKDLDIEWCCL